VSSGHILYIPLILFLGVILGFVLGRQAAVREADSAARRLREREARAAQLRSELAGGDETERER
jgi:hypothetical protein